MYQQNIMGIPNRGIPINNYLSWGPDERDYSFGNQLGGEGNDLGLLYYSDAFGLYPEPTQPIMQGSGRAESINAGVPSQQQNAASQSIRSSTRAIGVGDAPQIVDYKAELRNLTITQVWGSGDLLAVQLAMDPHGLLLAGDLQRSGVSLGRGPFTVSLGVTLSGTLFGIGGGGGTFFNIGYNPETGFSLSVTGTAGGGATAGLGGGLGIVAMLSNAPDVAALLGTFHEISRAGLGRQGVGYFQDPGGAVKGITVGRTLLGKGYVGASGGMSTTSAIVQYISGRGWSFFVPGNR